MEICIREGSMVFSLNVMERKNHLISWDKYTEDFLNPTTLVL